MQSVTNDTFGPLIAYLIPGAVALVGLSPYLPSVEAWFAATPENAPTIGGFLYLTVASLAVGMVLNAIRWAVIDTLHARTGIPPPPSDFSRLGRNVEGMRLLIEIHYRFYQHHANMLVAIGIAWVAHRMAVGWTVPAGPLDVAALVLAPVFFAMSRDTLRKYHVRARQLLAGPTSSPSPAPSPAARRTPGGSSRGRRARS
jgi:hypothetical protein